MSTTEIVIYAVFALAVVLPLLPGLFELSFGRDNEPLQIDQRYARDPRFLGKSMRAKALPIVNAKVAEYRAPFLKRRNEFARVVDELELVDGARINDVVLAKGTFTSGRNVSLRDVYTKGRANVGDGSDVRTLAADGGATIGSRAKVSRWIDVDGDCAVGRECELGQSVSATGALLVGEGATFSRLFGLPVAVGATIPPTMGNGVAIDMTADNARQMVDSIRIPAGETYMGDIIASRDVVVGAGATLRGSIKAGGTVVIHGRAKVLGNVVAHGDVSIEANGAVYGHVFTERNIALARGATVGRPNAPKTLHALERVTLSTSVAIHGWAISERGGRTVAGAIALLAGLTLSFALATAPVRAGELSTTTSVSTFSSPGDLYGPWQTQTLEYQWEAGPLDIPSVTLVNRNDTDRIAPFSTTLRTHSTALYADDYHTWSKRFFTYGQIESAEGNILPTRSAYLEGDEKFGATQNVLLGFGGGLFVNPDTSVTRELAVGPSLYSGRMVYTARYLFTNISGSFSAPHASGTTTSNGSAVQLIAEYIALGRNQATFAYLGGRQPGVVVGNLASVPPSLTNVQNISQFNVWWKHWIRKNFGFEVGATFGTHDYANPPLGVPSRIYNQNGVTLGVFFGQPIGLPKQ